MRRLTFRERELIRRALKIAGEDGSIYGSAETDADRKRIDLEIEEIERKMNEE
jgi:hypothetical protein